MTHFGVFGGSGFIGTNLCQALARDGHVVTSFDNIAFRGANPGIRSQAFDFSAPGDLNRALADVDVVVHLISTMLPSPSNSEPIRDVQENLVGSLRLIDAVKKSPVRRFIFLSSGGTVYGSQSKIPISECAKSDPLCSYGIVKRSIEQYLALHRHLHGLDYFALRVANPYGPFQRPGGQGLVANVIDKALHSQPVVIWGDGSVVRDYIFIDDVIDAILAAARCDDAAATRVLNIGSGIGRSVLDVVSSIEKMMDTTIAKQFIASRPSDVPVNVLDIARAGEVLLWQPTSDWVRVCAQHAIGWRVTIPEHDCCISEETIRCREFEG